jgi:hypothetical protein
MKRIISRNNHSRGPRLETGGSRRFLRAADGRRFAGGWHFLLLAPLIFLAFSGCSVVSTPTRQSTALFRSFEGEVGLRRSGTNDVSTMQSEVMREADDYVGIIAQACDDMAARVGTPEAKVSALQWKLQQATAAYMNATGENPGLGAVDMAVLASLSTKVVEDYWVGRKFGAAAEPVLKAQKALEEAAWELVNKVLTPSQQLELHALIDNWMEKNPTQRYVGAMRLRNFAGILGHKMVQEQGSKPNSLLAILNVDPLAGLDPAVVAIEQTRLMAERVTYYLERAPALMSWQVELMTYRLADQPASQQVLSNLNTLSQSAAIFGDTARQLPKLVNDQREAAINQIFAGISNERSNIMVSLDSQETKLRELLPQVRETLVAADKMGASLDGAVKSLDTFVRYVSPPDTNPPAAATNSQPFNVLDYGKAAGEVGAMAKDLNLLLGSANQSATQLAVLSEHAGGTAERVVDRAFIRGLLLIFIFLAGATGAALLYRYLSLRMTRNRPIEVRTER